MKIADFLSTFNKVIPLAAAGYAKDAVGLQVGFERGTELRKLLLAYEITDEVVDEAIRVGANLIVSYHPLIFPNIPSVTDSTRTGALVRRLIKNEISLYVVHTAFDANPDFGTSRLMADSLGLKSIQTLVPLTELLEKIVVFVPKLNAEAVREAMWKAGAGDIGNYDECSYSSEGSGTFRGNAESNPTIGKPLVRESVDEVRLEMICEKWNTAKVIEIMKAVHPYEEVAYDRYPLNNSHPKFGMGSIGRWNESKNLEDVLDLISKAFGTPVLRHNGVKKESYKQIAMVGGAGMEYYSAARSQGADIFITGDIRYHEFYKAEHDNVLLVDAGHAETEHFVTSGMLKAVDAVRNVVNLHNELPQSLVIQSEVCPNVVSYYHKEEQP